jgi:hypothetical protein
MPTAWQIITLAKLNDYLVSAQVEAVNTAALAEGQADRFTNVMTNVVNSVRTKIETCTRNRVSATPLSVPPSLVEHTCMIIIDALQGSVPGLALSDDQVRRINRFRDDLDRVAKCDLAVEQPLDPLDPPNAQGNVLPSVEKKHLRYTRRDQDGV